MIKTINKTTCTNMCLFDEACCCDVKRATVKYSNLTGKNENNVRKCNYSRLQHIYHYISAYTSNSNIYHYISAYKANKLFLTLASIKQ